MGINYLPTHCGCVGAVSSDLLNKPLNRSSDLSLSLAQKPATYTLSLCSPFRANNNSSFVLFLQASSMNRSGCIIICRICDIRHYKAYNDKRRTFQHERRLPYYETLSVDCVHFPF